MNILKNKYLQFLFETLLIAGISYFLYQFFPSLPWWSAAVVAGVVAFVLNIEMKSFFTGFTAVALLWGIAAFQLNDGNAGLLATKVGELLSGNAFIAQLGVLTPLRLVYITAIVGGLIGGFGAMTGSYGRMMLQSKTEEMLEAV
jgi:hypothetical protein